MGERPTAAEKADAAERFIDALDVVKAALDDAYDILRERRSGGSTFGTLFPFIADDLGGALRKAGEALWPADEKASVQAFRQRRAAEREAHDA